MGKRGPQPQPTVLKLARGNPGHRPVNHDEPDLPAGPRAVPKGMTGKAREEWERLIDVLTDSGVLTVGDMDAFEEYCYIVGDVHQYRALVRKVGTEKAAALGYANHLNKLRLQKRQQAAHLGLTPSSRSGVKATGAKPADAEADKRARFFGGKKA